MYVHFLLLLVDFDEQTADDWDVDMSAYYEKGAGDKDARDYLSIRQEKRRRDGIEDTDRFTVGKLPIISTIHLNTMYTCICLEDDL